MLKLFRIFFENRHVNSRLVVACLVVAGALETIGLAVLLPVFSFATGGGGETSSEFGNLMLAAIARLGITPRPATLIVIVIAVFILKYFLTFVSQSIAGFATAEIASELRRDVLNALFDAKWGFLVQRRAGFIANALSGEATRVGDAYMASAKSVALSFQIMVYFIVALLISWQLSLAGIVLSGGLYLVFSRVVKLSARAGERQWQATSKLVVNATDALANVKAIKAMQRQQHFNTLFAKRITRLRKALRRAIALRHLIDNGNDAIIVILFGAGFLIAVEYIRVEVSALLVMALIMLQGASKWRELQGMLFNVAELETSYHAGESLVEDLRAEAEPVTGDRKADLTQDCRFENVSFAHGDLPVVDKVSFRISAGDLCVLQGPSGAGKTTIVDLLLGLHRPDSGEVLIDGVPLREIDIGDWRGKVGYVPQELNLLHGTVRENVAFGDETIDDKAILASLKRAHAEDLLDLLADGLDTDVGEMGGRLSGGQRQRLALARALVHDPQLLILDEVTSALDPRTEREICTNIGDLKGSLTIIAITHRAIWDDLANSVLRIEKGSVTERATAGEG